jgi:hypothetical protein
VAQLLERAGFESAVGETGTVQLSESGKGFLLTFENQTEVRNILGNQSLFAGGSFGGQLHQGELEGAFGGEKGATILDYRSLTGAGKLGDRSLQVTLLIGKGGNVRGAYTDTDAYNFRQGFGGFLGHTFLELIPHEARRALRRLLGRRNC